MRRLPLRSPPRVRGKEWYLQGESPAPGITPAYAGKSTTAGRGRMPSRDHPRVCGEKGFVNHDWKGLEGSPPRMRGKVHVSPGQVGGVGITPAYAGKSCTEGHSRPVRRDHPRVCGEKSYAATIWRITQGSPPRMRGKGSCPSRCACTAGITPACAGKSRATPAQ